jgi:GDP-D-mannose dehydratase
MNEMAGYEISVEVNQELIRPNEIKFLKGNNQLLKNLINYVPETPFEKVLRKMYLF